MLITADLHLHSKYSRAVSPDMTLPQLASWARLKGIQLLATGDWTHPLWFKELQAHLKETAPGLYQLKTDPTSPHFLLSTEISSIYTQDHKGRRVHTLVFAPHLETAAKINSRLSASGAHLMSDGRPTIGLSVKQLAELVLSIDSQCLIIPAHIWTPWYAVFGSLSGFDNLEEAFQEFARYIFAIETGMSSDPAMNWLIRDLTSRAIVSFSDAHSLSHIGREATVFEVGDNPLSYSLFRQAILNSAKQTISKTNPNSPASSFEPYISHTIEFYPEEGKYHYTGHRKCQIVYSPQDSKKSGNLCPVCGNKLTLGVMHRVQALSDPSLLSLTPHLLTDEYHTTWYQHPKANRSPFVKIVPLQEILAESFSLGKSTKKVRNEYEKLTTKLGPEFDLLLRTNTEKIASLAGPQVAAAIEKVRAGNIFIYPGYDGVYGQVKIFSSPPPLPPAPKQTTLF